MDGAPPSKTLGCPLREPFGFHRVEITWSVPELPPDAQFGSHVLLPSGTARVAAVSRSSLFVSDDSGAHWREVPVELRGGLRMDNAYVRADGGVLVQTRGLHALDDREEHEEDFARIYAFDASLRPEGEVRVGLSQWHGSGGIDEHDGTLIWAEYAPNPIRWKRRQPPAERDAELNLDSHAYRSTDGGLTWETVLSCPWQEVRHFHTVRADRHEAGAWWASTGDVGEQCRVFRSRDDGRSWADVTGEPEIPLLNPEARSWHALHRYTDVVVTEDRLIWGTDDYLGRPEAVNDSNVPLGQRIGSRLCVARKDERIRPEARGWIGNPVRSIVDVGPAWLFVTQAKRLELPRPQLVLVGKEEPFPMQEIGTVDLFGRGTPFTFSRASRVAVDGCFFSFRQRQDVFAGGPSVLRWNVRFC